MDYASIFKGINIQCYKMELGTPKKHMNKQKQFLLKTKYFPE